MESIDHIEADYAAKSTARAALEQGQQTGQVEKDGWTSVDDRRSALGERGQALELNDRIKGRYLFNVNTGIWLRFDGNIWVVDYENAIYREFNAMADKVEKRINLLNSRRTDQNNLDAQINKLRRLFDRLNTVRFREAVIRSAATCADNPPTITTAQLDPDKYLIACNNLVVNLRTGEARKGQPEDLLTKRTNIDWHGITAQAPTWLKALENAHDDPDEIGFLQRLVGCALRGDGPREQKILLAQGSGSNFKGCYQRALLNAVGDYGATIPTELLLDSKFPRPAAAPDAALVDLRGRRFLFASESDQNRRMSPSRAKALSGNDEVVARAPNDREMSRFPSTWFITVFTNFAPIAPPGDPAYMRRILYLKYKNVFVTSPKEPHERLIDPDLDEKLKKEAPGILAWIVKGSLLYQKHGLCPPRSVVEAVAEYELRDDYIKQFCNEMIEDIPDSWEPVKETYNTFRKWFAMVIDDREKSIPGMRTFNELFQRKYAKKRNGSGYVYPGIKILQMPTM